MKNITFILPTEKTLVEIALRRTEGSLQRLQNCLKKWGLDASVEGILHRAKLGPRHELDEVLKEVETYIQSTKMPSYLREEAREKARNSVNAEMIADLEGALSFWNKDWTEADFSLNGAGEIVFSESYKNKRMKERERTLTPDELEDFPVIKECLRLFRLYRGKYRLGQILERLGPLPDKVTDRELAIAMHSLRFLPPQVD